MSKIKQFFKNISPLNNRTEMPVMLYILKVIVIFWFVKFGSEVIGEAAVIALHFACGMNPLRGEVFDYNTITLIMYYGYGLLVGIMILYWRVIQKKSIAKLGFTGSGRGCFLGVVLGVLLVSIAVLLVILTGTISYNGVFGRIDGVLIVLMLGGFICQGMMEEVLCRGIALGLLRMRTSNPVAIAVSTVLFIIPHISKMSGAGVAITGLAIVNLILVSTLFSLLTIHFNSIWAACGLHTIWNFTLYNVFGLNLSGNAENVTAIFDMRSVGNNIFNGGVYGIEASVVTAAVLALAVCLMLVAAKKKGGMNHGI